MSRQCGFKKFRAKYAAYGISYLNNLSEQATLDLIQARTKYQFYLKTI